MTQPNQHALLLILTSLFWLLGCEPRSNENGVEAVYDSQRYRIAFSGGKLEVFDYISGTIALSTAAEDLVIAEQLELSATSTHGIFDIHERAAKRCHTSRVNSAVPKIHYLLLEGGFDSPDCELKFSLRISVDQQQISIDSRVDHPEINSVSITLDAAVDELILGFGAQTSINNFKGHRVPIWIQEQGIGRGQQPISSLINSNIAGLSGNKFTSYFSLPYYYSSSGFKIALDNIEPAQFDFSSPDRTTIKVYNNRLQLTYKQCHQSPLECFDESSSTDRIELPDWAHQGAIIGLTGGQDRVVQTHQQLIAAGVSVSAVLIGDWTGTMDERSSTGTQLHWNWLLDETMYPEWADLRQQLKAHNTRLLGYFTPMLTNTESASETANNLYQQALEKGYLVSDDKGKPVALNIVNAESSLVDLTNSEAYAWLKGIIREQIQTLGFSGWFADFGENLPANVKLHNGADALQFHNQFSVQWARLNRDIVNELKQPEDVFFIMRAGYSASKSLAPVFSLGNQNTAWDNHDGLQSTITGLNNGGLSGIPLLYGDAGGFTSFHREVSSIASWVLPNDLVLRQPAESVTNNNQIAMRRRSNLLSRWVELSAFTPLLKVDEGRVASINAQVYDSSSLDHFAKFSSIYTALFDYRQLLLQEAKTRGWPVVRHPLLHFPNSEYFQKMRGARQQFMLGDSILIAPMLTPRNQSVHREVYLPPGNWIDFWTQAKLQVAGEGLLMRLAPAMGQPPVFVEDNERTHEVIAPALRRYGLWPAKQPAEEKAASDSTDDSADVETSISTEHTNRIKPSEL